MERTNIPLKLNEAQAGDIHQNNVIFILLVDEEGNAKGALHKIQIRSLKTIQWVFNKSVDRQYRILVMPPGPAEFLSIGLILDEENIVKSVDGNGEHTESYIYFNDKIELIWNAESGRIKITNVNDKSDILFVGTVYTQWEFAILLRQLGLNR